MNRLFATMSVVFLTGIAPMAQAATLTFDFTGHGQNHATMTVGASEDSSVTVNVTGQYYDLVDGAFAGGDAIDVDSGSVGLRSKNWIGHYNSPDRNGETQDIDSFGIGNQAMIFNFGRDVRITGINISRAYGSGAYDVFVGRLFAGNTILDGITLPTDTSSFFAIGARRLEMEAPCEGVEADQQICTVVTNSSISINSITIEIPDVPVPASAALLLGAFGGLAMMRRRKTYS